MYFSCLSRLLLKALFCTINLISTHLKRVLAKLKNIMRRRGYRIKQCGFSKISGRPLPEFKGVRIK